MKKIYDEIYSKIAKKEHTKTLLDRAYILIISTYTPLTNIELITTISLNPDEDAFHLIDEVDERLILDLCNNLLVFNSPRNI